MQVIQGLFDFIKHFLAQDATIREYGTQIYLLLFLIVFVETGLVVMPFLPGDSLLFAAGALAASGTLEIGWLLPILVLAALTGDNVNYAIGKFLGPRLLKSEKSRFLNRKHLDRTHAYFDKYGGKTIIMARFIPIVRTFTPFVAGIGAMTYPRFLAYSIAGALLWVGSCTTLGYFFGGLDFVKKRFEVVIIAIVLISVLPAFLEYLKHRRQRVDEVATEPAGE